MFHEICACQLLFMACLCFYMYQQVYEHIQILLTFQQMLLTFALAHHHHITTANEAFSIQSDAYHLLTKTSC
jgi:hypothetical protein